MKKAHGFTLLEVLVALGIVALISVLSWRGLEEVLRSAQRVQNIDTQLQTVGAVFSQFEKDLAALELNTGVSTPETDFVEITGNGLLLQLTRRNTSEPAYRERIEWILNGKTLIRTVERTLDSKQNTGQNARQKSTSDAIATDGMQIRLLREPGGWISPATFGNYRAQQSSDLALQGRPLTVDTGTPITDPEKAGPLLVRAVEISITQPNSQTVTRVFLTGGVY